MDPQKSPRVRLGRGVSRAYEALADGWRELLNKSSGALVHFKAFPDENESPEPRASPSWNLMSAEIWETAKSVIVRMEIPGVEGRDLDVSITGCSLRVRGERRTGGDDDKEVRVYALAERAYGRFERRIPLPQGIEKAIADIVCENGVLTVILQKREVVAPPKD